MRELQLRSLSAVKQQHVRIEYKGLVFEESLKFDVLIEGRLVDFHEVRLTDGVSRLLLPGSNR